MGKGKKVLMEEVERSEKKAGMERFRKVERLR